METSAEEVVVVRETLGEISDAMNYSDNEFTKKVKANADSLSVIKASICATNALVTESLKVGCTIRNLSLFSLLSDLANIRFNLQLFALFKFVINH